MPRVKESDKLIPKIYRRKYSDLGMYFYVRGQKDIMPAVPLVKAIENYYKSVREDDYDLQGSLTELTRMNHEFYESQRCDE